MIYFTCLSYILLTSSLAQGARLFEFATTTDEGAPPCSRPSEIRTVFVCSIRVIVKDRPFYLSVGHDTALIIALSNLR
jgi:hypothetical protein